MEWQTNGSSEPHPLQDKRWEEEDGNVGMIGAVQDGQFGGGEGLARLVGMCTVKLRGSKGEVIMQRVLGKVILCGPKNKKDVESMEWSRTSLGVAGERSTEWFGGVVASVE